MFYSQFILAKKGPLGTIWIAAHLERKLRKNQVADTDIGVSVDSILFPEVPIALRLSSHLLLGVVRIYSRKVNYLFDDCSEALLKVKQAFRSTAVDLPPEESTAPYHSITLPETFDLDDFELPDTDFFQGNYVDHHVSARDQITLQDTLEGVVYSTSQFGLDERFGDGDTSQIGLDLDEDLFLDKVVASEPTAVTLDLENDPQASVQYQPLKDDQDEEIIKPSEDVPAIGSGSQVDGLDLDNHLMELAHAPSTPGLMEEPNLLNGQEEALASDDHVEAEVHNSTELIAKPDLDGNSRVNDWPMQIDMNSETTICMPTEETAHHSSHDNAPSAEPIQPIFTNDQGQECGEPHDSVYDEMVSSPYCPNEVSLLEDPSNKPCEDTENIAEKSHFSIAAQPAPDGMLDNVEEIHEREGGQCIVENSTNMEELCPPDGPGLDLNFQAFHGPKDFDNLEDMSNKDMSFSGMHILGGFNSIAIPVVSSEAVVQESSLEASGKDDLLHASGASTEVQGGGSDIADVLKSFSGAGQVAELALHEDPSKLDGRSDNEKPFTPLLQNTPVVSGLPMPEMLLSLQQTQTDPQTTILFDLEADPTDVLKSSPAVDPIAELALHEDPRKLDGRLDNEVPFTPLLQNTPVVSELPVPELRSVQQGQTDPQTNILIDMEADPTGVLKSAPEVEPIAEVALREDPRKLYARLDNEIPFTPLSHNTHVVSELPVPEMLLSVQQRHTDPQNNILFDLEAGPTDVLKPTPEADPIAEFASCEDRCKLYGWLDNEISFTPPLQNTPVVSDFSMPEMLPSVQQRRTDPPTNILFNLGGTPDVGRFDSIGTLTGKKRSFTESTLVLPSLNSVETSGLFESRRTGGSIPCDNDLLSSILVGRSTVLKTKPTPQPEISTSKRPRTTARASASKRKVLMDDSMVLHGDAIRQQLISTEDIRRARKKAPCTRREIWMIRTQVLEDEIFSKPIFDGMSAELVSLHPPMSVLVSRTRAPQNHENKSQPETAKDTDFSIRRHDHVETATKGSTGPLKNSNAEITQQPPEVPEETGNMKSADQPGGFQGHDTQVQGSIQNADQPWGFQGHGTHVQGSIQSADQPRGFQGHGTHVQGSIQGADLPGGFQGHGTHVQVSIQRADQPGGFQGHDTHVQGSMQSADEPGGFQGHETHVQGRIQSADQPEGFQGHVTQVQMNDVEDLGLQLKKLVLGDVTEMVTEGGKVAVSDAAEPAVTLKPVTNDICDTSAPLADGSAPLDETTGSDASASLLTDLAGSADGSAPLDKTSGPSFLESDQMLDDQYFDMSDLKDLDPTITTEASKTNEENLTEAAGAAASTENNEFLVDEQYIDLSNAKDLDATTATEDLKTNEENFTEASKENEFFVVDVEDGHRDFSMAAENATPSITNVPVETGACSDLVVLCDDQAVKESVEKKPVIIDLDEIPDDEYDDKNPLANLNGFEEPKVELDMDTRNATLNHAQDPVFHGADWMTSLDADITAGDMHFLDECEDVENAVAGNDTEFLNADVDDDDDYQEDDCIPAGEETRLLDNTGWSSRTRAVAKYLQTLFDKEADRGRKVLPMNSLLVGKTRKEASRMFFETLVLKTRDYIQVEQEVAFDNINIKAGVKLLKSDF